MICRDGFSGFKAFRRWCGFMCRELGSVRRCGGIWAQIDADKPLYRLHRRDQRGDAHDLHDAFEIIGQHVQRHFGADPFQRLHLEVGVSHPVLDGAEGMLDGLAPLAHFLRMLVEPLLDGLQNALMFPPRDPVLLARGALILDSTALAGIGPLAVQGQTLFHVREVIIQALTGGADIDIVFSHITEVLLAEPAVGLDA